jgi:hypothetical protein
MLAFRLCVGPPCPPVAPRPRSARPLLQDTLGGVQETKTPTTPLRQREIRQAPLACVSLFWSPPSSPGLKPGPGRAAAWRRARGLLARAAAFCVCCAQRAQASRGTRLGRGGAPPGLLGPAVAWSCLYLQARGPVPTRPARAASRRAAWPACHRLRLGARARPWQPERQTAHGHAPLQPARVAAPHRGGRRRHTRAQPAPARPSSEAAAPAPRSRPRPRGRGCVAGGTGASARRPPLRARRDALRRHHRRTLACRLRRGRPTSGCRPRPRRRPRGTLCPHPAPP